MEEGRKKEEKAENVEMEVLPLKNAAKRRKPKIQRKGSAVELEDSFAIGSFLYAASKGDGAEVAKMLSTGGVHINDGNYDNRTALHIACAEGHLEIVKYLVEAGADVNIQDRWGGTPLDDAISQGHDLIAKYLKESGALHGENSNFGLDLIHAASRGDVETVKRLVESGISVQSCDYDKRTPLHVAIDERHEDVVKYLLEKGADVHAKDKFGGTPHQEAHRTAVRLGKDPILEMLEAATGEVRDKKPFWHRFANGFFLTFPMWEIIFGVLFAIFVKYGDSDSGMLENATGIAEMNHYYPFYMDVHVMIFIGFGYLMTFLRKYGYTSVGFTFLIGAFTIQWYILVGAFFEQAISIGEFTKIDVNIPLLIRADFCAGAILISFGALLGKTSASQMLGICIFEAVLYSVNESIGLKLGIADVGGSMVIHVFGAYFGLAASAVMTPPEARGNNDNSANYRADLFSMIGTVFLWMYWPSFNAATAAAGVSQHRAVVNTVISISASCVVAFLSSQFIRNEKVFHMVDIQNATLAGGVAMGTSANMVIHPAVAILIGATAGFVSVFGFAKLQSFLEQRLGIHDTCGINNLHGMPGIIGAISGIIASRVADPTLYGEEQLAAVFPLMAERGPEKQAAYQLAYLAITLAIAIIGGTLTGVLVKGFMAVKRNFFLDSELWEVPSLETPYYFDKRGEINRNQDDIGNAKAYAGHLETKMAMLEQKLKKLESAKYPAETLRKRNLEPIVYQAQAPPVQQSLPNNATNLLLETLVEKVNILLNKNH